MNIELRKVKYAAFASQETPCFEAEVWIDGKNAGRVSNEGHGGPDLFRSPDTERRLNEHAKTLPPYVFGDSKLDMGAELIVGGLLGDWLLARDLKRALKAKLLYTKPGEAALYETKRVQPAAMTHFLQDTDQQERLRAKFNADRFLNLMPFDEALKLFKGVVA